MADEHVTFLGGRPEVHAAAVDLFRERLALTPVLHHLARYDHGAIGFTVDRLDDPGADAAQAGASPERRPFYLAAEQQLAFLVTALDRELDPAETGRLIRVVLHAEQGAMFCGSVTPRTWVLGIAFGQAAARPGRPPQVLPRVGLVRDADIALSGLSTELRDILSLPSQNLGGWLTAPPDGPGPSRDEAPPDGDHQAGLLATGTSPLVDRLADLLDARELVYAAHVASGKVTGSADLFGNVAVASARPPGMDASASRAFYGQLAGQVAVHVRMLGQIARQAVRGRLLRVVLDVEQGAVYYYRLGASDYLVGVTINQKRVSSADDRMGELATGLRRAARSPAAD
ncbi:hypothetical protein AGRA3207_002037 [Actinomadura graeca]|uniref:Roadblock/LAMTOR2 domain-containing protein n=1 Tax=Actinomadura graeca TaxID=2750812 RepID=A0ABX8QQZ8_9ACTN|nr:hypothetical protein [Actinomadura graeca]QXJ21205.1 hypothetical protein AGRA3207_002037 [Actinomadura graeca]